MTEPSRPTSADGHGGGPDRIGDAPATITELVRRAERAQAEAEAAEKKIRSSAETMLEALYRRDAEVDDRVAAHRRRLEDDALGGLADLLEGGMAEARAVVAQVPAMVDEAFRARLERYEADRRESEMGMVSQLRAETELAQESRLRSFEEMMATRERVVDDRAAAHDEAHREEQRELALLRGQLSRLVAGTLPLMVADAVSDAIRCLRTEQESVRRETERRGAETEALTAELRVAVAETQAALALDGAVGRQAEAYRQALEELRSAIGQPVARQRPVGAHDPVRPAWTAEVAAALRQTDSTRHLGPVGGRGRCGCSTRRRGRAPVGCIGGES